MPRCIRIAAASLVAILALVRPGAAGDIELAKNSTLESILQKGELRVGFEAGNMPFEMIDRKGRFVGFDIDMAREMARAMGVRFVPVNTPWDTIIPSLITEKFDLIMSGMTVTPKRNLQINFADPYFFVGQTLIIRKELEGKIQSHKDLDSPNFIVTSKRGTTGEQAVRQKIPKCTYKSYPTEIEAALEVVNGKAHAFVYDLPYCVIFMAQQGDEKLAFIDRPFTHEPLAWGFRKGDPDLENWLNHFLAQMKRDGRYDRIYSRWITSKDWYSDIAR